MVHQSQSGGPRHILACEQLGPLMMPLSYLITMQSPVTNYLVYVLTVPDQIRQTQNEHTLAYICKFNKVDETKYKIYFVLFSTESMQKKESTN